MNIFACVVPQDPTEIDGYLSFLPRAVEATAPVGNLHFNGLVWRNPFSLAVSYSIHADTSPIRDYVGLTEDSFTTFNGIPQLIGTQGEAWGQILADGIVSGSLSLAEIGGYFNVLHVDSGTVLAANCLSRIEPIYWCAHNGNVVIGNKAALVQALARKSIDFRFDLDALISLSLIGWPLHDETPYEGVHVLDNAQEIRIAPGGTYRIRSYRELYTSNEPIEEKQKAILYEEICEQFRLGLESLRPFVSSVKLLLSGGKDSRVMAAMVAAYDMPFFCETAGSPESRDVIVATEVGRLLNAEHRFTPPRTSTEIPRVDIFQMLKRTVSQADGMTNVADPIYPAKPKATVNLSGHAGECFRGGYDMLRTGNRPPITSPDIARTFLKNLSLPQSRELLKQSAIERQQHINELVFEKFKSTAFPTDHFYDYMYTVYRVGRAMSSMRQGAAYGAFAYSPFLNDHVLDLCFRLPLEDKKQDRAYFNLLKILKPELAYHRFSDSRWKFEAEGPEPGTSRVDWLKREPLPPDPHSAGIQAWTAGLNDYMRPIVYDYLQEQRDSIIFEIVDWSKIENLLGKQNELEPPLIRKILSVLTMVYFVAGEWRPTSFDVSYRTVAFSHASD